MSTIWIIGGVVVLLAGIAARIRRARYGDSSLLTDDHIRGIEGTGRLDLEDAEPLDVKEAQAEEARFWEETWDEPEEL